MPPLKVKPLDNADSYIRGEKRGIAKTKILYNKGLFFYKQNNYESSIISINIFSLGSSLGCVLCSEMVGVVFKDMNFSDTGYCLPLSTPPNLTEVINHLECGAKKGSDKCYELLIGILIERGVSDVYDRVVREGIIYGSDWCISHYIESFTTKNKSVFLDYLFILAHRSQYAPLTCYAVARNSMLCQKNCEISYAFLLVSAGKKHAESMFHVGKKMIYTSETYDEGRKLIMESDKLGNKKSKYFIYEHLELFYSQ